MIRLASLAFHEHVHHFQQQGAPSEQNETEAYRLSAYVQITAKIEQIPLLKWSMDPPAPRKAQAVTVSQLERFATCRTVAITDSGKPVKLTPQDRAHASLELFIDLMTWTRMGCNKSATQAQVGLLSSDGGMGTAMLNIEDIRIPGYGEHMLTLNITDIDDPKGGRLYFTQISGALDNGKNDRMSVVMREYSREQDLPAHDVITQLRCKVDASIFTQRQVECSEDEMR